MFFLLLNLIKFCREILKKGMPAMTKCCQEEYPLSIFGNVSQLYADRDLNHLTFYEELSSKFATFLSYQAQYPCLRIVDVCAQHGHLFFTER